MSRSADLFLDSGAVFDPSERYRYRLWRRWSDAPPVMFLMLNPSTASEVDNDPTIRRCLGYARAWGAGGLEVCNLFAFRSSFPSALWSIDDPVGPDNDRAILEAAAGAGTIVAAWGIHGGYRGRAQAVLAHLALAGHRLHALRVTKDGYPCHPLYLPGNLRPRKWTR